MIAIHWVNLLTLAILEAAIVVSIIYVLWLRRRR